MKVGLVNQIRQGGLNWSYCKSSSSIFCSESEIEANFSEAGLVNQIGQPLSTDRIVWGLSHCSNCQHSFKTSQRWCILGRAIVFKPTAARYDVARFPTQSYWAFLETWHDIWWCFCQIGLVELWTSTAVKPMIKVWAARHNCVYNPLLWGVMLTLGDWERFISVFAILCLCICTWTFTVLSWGALRWLGVTGKSFKVLHLQVSLLQRLKKTPRTDRVLRNKESHRSKVKHRLAARLTL